MSITVWRDWYDNMQPSVLPKGIRIESNILPYGIPTIAGFEHPVKLNNTNLQFKLVYHRRRIHSTRQDSAAYHTKTLRLRYLYPSYLTTNWMTMCHQAHGRIAANWTHISICFVPIYQPVCLPVCLSARLVYTHQNIIPLYRLLEWISFVKLLSPTCLVFDEDSKEKRLDLRFYPFAVLHTSYKYCTKSTNVYNVTTFRILQEWIKLMRSEAKPCVFSLLVL